MKTRSIAVQNLCIPCENRCRYCLLSYDGKLRGVSYDRSERYAKRFYDWIQANLPEASFQFYFGYSMEHPRLLEAIDFMKRIGAAGGEFLQFDGMKFRSGTEIDELLSGIRQHGIRLIDMTFYGSREYHDRFAMRSGDFDYMIEIIHRAAAIGLDAQVSLPLTQENAGQADELVSMFESLTLKNLFCFVPHSEGRGASLDKVRLTLSDYEKLGERVKRRFNRKRFLTEREWIERHALPRYESRAITVSLTPQNIDRLEAQPFEETIAEIESLDDAYHAALPELASLTNLCGNPGSDAFYSARDLIQHYQRKFIKDHNLNLYDIHDERQHFVRRF